MHPRIESLMNEIEPDRFRILDGSFWRFFLQHLSDVARKHMRRDSPTRMEPAECAALALYRAAGLYARHEKAKYPDRMMLSPDDRPIEEAWKGLQGITPYPHGEYMILEDRGTSKLRLPRPGVYEHERLKIGISYSGDVTKLPKITIEVEGEPVALLMKARYELRDPFETRTVRREAARRWTAIWNQILAMIQLRGSRPGRPVRNFGRDAARFHLPSWQELASSGCRIVFRKAHSYETLRRESEAAGIALV